MTATLTEALILFFVVEFIRALPWPAVWLTRKPLVCHACMTGWLIIFVTLYEMNGGASWRAHVAAGGIALLLLTVRRKLMVETWSPPSGKD